MLSTAGGTESTVATESAASGTPLLDLLLELPREVGHIYGRRVGARRVRPDPLQADRGLGVGAVGCEGGLVRFGGARE